MKKCNMAVARKKANHDVTKLRITYVEEKNNIALISESISYYNKKKNGSLH